MGKYKATAVNVAYCWAAAFSVAFSFRFLTNALMPNGCLSIELVQFDELVRPLVVYLGTFLFYRFLGLIGRMEGFRKVDDLTSGAWPRAILILGSVLFEVAQTFLPIVNQVINMANVHPATCLLGSVEDVAMDSTVILLFKRIQGDKD